jgi:hypothetical protein
MLQAKQAEVERLQRTVTISGKGPVEGSRTDTDLVKTLKATVDQLER